MMMESNPSQEPTTIHHRSHTNASFPHLAGCLQCSFHPARLCLSHPVLLQPDDCRRIRSEELNQLCIMRNVGRPATKSVCPPHRRHTMKVHKTKRMVGPLRRASVLHTKLDEMKHQTHVPSSIGCEPSSPQAFLIFLNHETPSQHTMCDEVEMRDEGRG
jgi:hypothetical protein